MTATQLPYKNLHDTVKYVGMSECRTCHQDIYDTFIKTGMGQSFDHATPQKSAATFEPHTTIYDSLNNYFYHPYWRHDSLFIKEFRLSENKDTTHQRDQHIKYIIGSGQHTNSHIIEENGYLYQAPITFFTQKKIWDLAPGFEGGFSSRFNRIIGMECMSCHNSLPNFVEASENKFLTVPQGISCERCHGPGEAHIKEKKAGILVDTAKEIDYSIVNPRKLPRDRQIDLCQRCHLQGVMILEKGKQFDDFKPAMSLKSVMDIYLPEYSGNETQFIMASHAHRMKKSACFKKSDMTCISCHNPHVSVKYTARKTFNDACSNCHQATDNQQVSCSLPLTERITKNKNDCSTCHMEVSGSIDIPHVTIHDHFIRKPISEVEKNKVEKFIGLACINNDNPTDLSRSKALLHYYESYTSDPMLLDSVDFYLKKARTNKANPIDWLGVNVHYFYLKQDFDKLVEIADNQRLNHIGDAWTAYRLGEAFLQKKEAKKALIYLEKAVALLPLQLDFNNKLGVALLQNERIEAAAKVFEKVLGEDQYHLSALTNLGFVAVNLGDLERAERLYKKAMSLNPDYEPLLLNMAGFYLMKKNKLAAKKTLQKILQKNPNQAQAKAILKQMRGSL